MCIRDRLLVHPIFVKGGFHRIQGRNDGRGSHRKEFLPVPGQKRELRIDQGQHPGNPLFPADGKDFIQISRLRDCLLYTSRLRDGKVNGSRAGHMSVYRHIVRMPLC